MQPTLLRIITLPATGRPTGKIKMRQQWAEAQARILMEDPVDLKTGLP
jgi:hypothetical protein